MTRAAARAASERPSALCDGTSRAPGRAWWAWWVGVPETASGPLAVPAQAACRGAAADTRSSSGWPTPPLRPADTSHAYTRSTEREGASAGLMPPGRGPGTARGPSSVGAADRRARAVRVAHIGDAVAIRRVSGSRRGCTRPASDQRPGPRKARRRKDQQNMAAASPPFSRGKSPEDWCFTK